MKATDNKPTANTILNSEKLKVFRCPLWPLLFNIVLGSPSYSNQKRKKIIIIIIEGIQTGKEVKLSLFANDMILYLGNPKDAARNLHDCSPSGSSIHGILQARTLEGVSISSSGGSS